MTPPPEYAILIVGYTATFLSMVYRFPQIYRLYKTKGGDDISVLMIIIQQLCYILSILYGVLRLDYVYISGSIISFLQNLVILYMRRKYSNDTDIHRNTSSTPTPTTPYTRDEKV